MLSVNGKFKDITDDDLMTLGDRFAIGTAPKVLKRIKEVLECGPESGDFRNINKR